MGLNFNSPWLTCDACFAPVIADGLVYFLAEEDPDGVNEEAGTIRLVLDTFAGLLIACSPACMEKERASREAETTCSAPVRDYLARVCLDLGVSPLQVAEEALMDMGELPAKASPPRMEVDPALRADGLKMTREPLGELRKERTSHLRMRRA